MKYTEIQSKFGATYLVYILIIVYKFQVWHNCITLQMVIPHLDKRVETQ